MKFSLLTGLALLWLAAVQAGEPKSIAITVGQEFKVTLPANASTLINCVVVIKASKNGGKK